MKKISRRSVIKWGLAGGVAGAAFRSGASKALAVLLPTPDEIEGPFYPVRDQKDKDADLTQIAGRRSVASGQHIVVSGEVRDIHGNPVTNALLDIWQADANGRYRHPRDPSKAKPDENFQGWAIIYTDDNGKFRFKTVLPGAYPASNEWTRPPHIHFKISKPGYRALTTQMYFPDQPLNASDLLLNRKSKTEQAAMIAKRIGQQGNVVFYEYNVVLDI